LFYPVEYTRKDIMPSSGLPARENRADPQGSSRPFSPFQNERLGIECFGKQFPELFVGLFAFIRIFPETDFIQIPEDIGESRLIGKSFFLQQTQFHSVPIFLSGKIARKQILCLVVPFDAMLNLRSSIIEVSTPNLFKNFR